MHAIRLPHDDRVQPADLPEGFRVELAQSRKERLFLIRRVALSARSEVLQRSLYCAALLLG